MTLTEKVRGNLGGEAFRVFEITGLSSGAVVISMGALNMNYVKWGEYTPTKATVSAGTTTLPVLKVSESSVGGTIITLSGIANSADSGTLTLWGY